MKPMTFEQFRATGRDVEALDDAVPGLDLEGPGRVYLDGLYVEKMTDGRWYLLIENADWIEEDTVAGLRELEWRLYFFAIGEQLLYPKPDVPVTVNAQLLEAVKHALAIEESVTLGLERELRVGYPEMLRAAIAAAGVEP